MKQEQIEELKKLSGAATPQPWSGPPGYIHIRSVPRIQEYNEREAKIPDDAPDEAYDDLPDIDVAYVPRRGSGDIATTQGNKDGELIVAAVNALPTLLREREQLLLAVKHAVIALEAYEEQEPTATLAGLYLPEARAAIAAAES